MQTIDITPAVPYRPSANIVFSGANRRLRRDSTPENIAGCRSLKPSQPPAAVYSTFADRKISPSSLKDGGMDRPRCGRVPPPQVFVFSVLFLCTGACLLPFALFLPSTSVKFVFFYVFRCVCVGLFVFKFFFFYFGW